MLQKLISITAASTLLLSTYAFSIGGQHNQKACYVQLKNGTQTSSPCSARGTTCNADFTCTIDGIPGIGKQGDANEKARTKMKPVEMKPKAALKKKAKTKAEVKPKTDSKK